MDAAAETEVLTVRAGDTMELAHQRSQPWEWADDQFYDCPLDRGSCIPAEKNVSNLSSPSFTSQLALAAKRPHTKWGKNLQVNQTNPDISI